MARKTNYTKTARDLAEALNAPVEQVVEVAYRFRCGPADRRENTEADVCSWLHTRLSHGARDAFAAAELAAIHGPEAACLLRRFIRTETRRRSSAQGLVNLRVELYELFDGYDGAGGGYFADQADADRAAELARELYQMLNSTASPCSTLEPQPLDTDISFDGVRPSRVEKITFGSER